MLMPSSNDVFTLNNSMLMTILAISDPPRGEHAHTNTTHGTRALR
jgi:hypothetical protein